MTGLFPAAIIHLDLVDGIPAETLNTAGRAAYIVFWWRGIPLAHRHVRGDAFPIPEGQLWEIALQAVSPAVSAYLADRECKTPGLKAAEARTGDGAFNLQSLISLKNPLDALDSRPPEGLAKGISVIVCTRDRPESLSHCLQSLLSCASTPEEIVVVDNCPTSDATRRLVDRYPQVRYVLEPRPGLDIARNTGVCCTQGEVVAFVDDDVTVHPDWAGRLRECFSDSQVMAATGLVLPRELETEAQGLFEQYWGFNRGYRVVTYDTAYFEKLKPWGVPVWEIGAGANMVFRRKAFDQVGNFDVRLDVGAAGCSGDSELWYRLLAAGLICRYEPRMTAFHDHRRDMVALRHQLYSYMRGHTAALLIQFAKHKHWGNLVRLLILLPWHYARLVAQGLRHGFQGRHRLMPSEWAGCLAGVYFFLRHMRSPPIDKAPLDKPSGPPS